ncbi:MAG: helix-turn-helix domain-containing protein [Flavobacteriaceae bacterium]|nr:helix-turn-helix domain-containing protein [Flavobacteriaceae bacterium]
MSKINKDLVYTVKEVEELLNVHPRKLHRIGKKEGIKKVDNRYLFKGDFLIEYFNLTTFDNVETMSNNVESFVEKDVELKGMELRVNNLNDKLRQEQTENNSLRNQVEELRIQMEKLIASNNKDLDNTPPMSNNVETPKTKTSADWYKSVHPKGKEIKNDKGQIIDIQPPMNDINFQSWKVDFGDWKVDEWE